MKFYLIIFMSLLLSQDLFSDSTSLLIFCPRNSIEKTKLKEHLSFLKTPKDKIKFNQNCYDVITTNAKKNLYTKHIRSKLSDVIIKDPLPKNSSKKCRLSLKEKSFIQDKENTIGNNNQKFILKSQSKNIKDENQIQIRTIEGKEVRVNLTSTFFFLTCEIKQNSIQIKSRVTSKELILQNLIEINQNTWTELGKFYKNEQIKNKKFAINQNKYQNIKNTQYSRIMIMVSKEKN